MLEKEILTPPEHIYPIDEWRVVEKKYSKKLFCHQLFCQKFFFF